MSYDIRLCDPVTHETINLPSAHVMTGGTYRAVIDESGRWIPEPITEAWLNVTYNYADYYHKVFEPVYRPEHPEATDERYKEFGYKVGYLYGIRSIYGMTGAESIPVLKRAVEQLGDETDPDYWKPTEGNAKKPLLQLIAMAKLRPDGVWDGD